MSRAEPTPHVPKREIANAPGCRWEWHPHPDEAAMSQAAAAQITRKIRERRNALVGLASGVSPTRTYERLVETARAEPALFGRTRWIKLDEWGGLSMDDPGSCEQYLRRVLLDPLAVPAERYFGWQSQPPDPDAECRRVATWLARNGPIDLLVLGLGENGHLGFNEPAAVFQREPHIAQLSETSLSHSMLGQSQGRVAYGLTLGMSDIMEAREILLLVTGSRKSRQLQRLASDGMSPEFPASILRLHRSVSVFCDTAAAALLPPDVLVDSSAPTEQER